MHAPSYTPGHSRNVTEFMAKRSFASHGGFFASHLIPGLTVLDCGCGPGTITIGIADQVSPGLVTGIDFAASQIQQATAAAAAAAIQNAFFRVADCYDLPFEDGAFDRVFSHALLEHLTDPVRALRETQRVLKPDGMIGITSPDWAGFILAPTSAELTRAVAAYTALQQRNGGDVNVGRKLGAHLVAAGFSQVQMSARYECYPSLTLIGEYLAAQLEREGDLQSAGILRAWSASEGGLFAQAWVSAIGRKL